MIQRASGEPQPTLDATATNTPHAHPAAPHWLGALSTVPSQAYTAAVEFWANVTDTEHGTTQGARGESLLDADGRAVLRVTTGPEKGISLIVAVSDVAAAATTATELGAKPIERNLGVRPFQRGFIDLPHLRSPGGLPFQFIQAQTSSPLQSRPLKRTMIKQVCVDVPDDRWDTEVTFWSQLTVAPVQRLEEQFVRIEVPSSHPLGLFMQRLESAAPAVSAHLDFACPDRVAEMARQLELGAVHLAERDGWSVLQAPDGTIYCLTPHR